MTMGVADCFGLSLSLSLVKNTRDTAGSDRPG